MADKGVRAQKFKGRPLWNPSPTGFDGNSSPTEITLINYLFGQRLPSSEGFGGSWRASEGFREPQRVLVIESNIAGKLWKAFSKLSKMNGSSFLYVGSFKSYTLYIQSCLDSFASIKRAAFAHSPKLYSYAEKKVVPERFLKNTSNYFFLFK